MERFVIDQKTNTLVKCNHSMMWESWITLLSHINTRESRLIALDLIASII